MHTDVEWMIAKKVRQLINLTEMKLDKSEYNEN